MAHIDDTGDGAGAARRAKFGTLPERIRYEDMVTEQATPQGRAPSTYQAERSWTHFSCLAVDLGL